MDESILDSIKKALAVMPSYTAFDSTIIMCINSTFSILNQLGVGPSKAFFIEDNSSKWSEFIGDDNSIELVKSYMYAKVRLMFDPPTNASLIEVLNRSINEAEWRLNALVDPKKEEDSTNV